VRCAEAAAAGVALTRMSDPAATAAPPAAERASGFLANLLDLFFAPGEAFAAMLRKPGFLVPMVLHVALAASFTGIWLQKVDKIEFMKAQMEQSPRWERVPVEQRPAILERQASFFPVFAWSGALVFAPLLTFVVAGIYLFVFRFFYASEIDYKRSLTVVASSLATVAIVSTPLILGVLALKGDWNINPQEALQANPSMFLEKQATAKPLWALASSLDLFMFWLLFLFASGYGAASRRSWSWALPGVAVPWMLLVIGKVALAFAF
jgi:hypothetical protein